IPLFTRDILPAATGREHLVPHIRPVYVIFACAILPAAVVLAGPVTLPSDLVIDNGDSFTIPQDTQPTFRSVTIGDAGAGTLVIPEFGPTTIDGLLCLGVQKSGSGTLTIQPGAGFDAGGAVTVGVAGTGSIFVQSDARFLV